MKLFQTTLPLVSHYKKSEIIVVGGGIMGATIAQVLRSKGKEVIVFDDGRDFDGTRPCGGSVKPSPLTGLKKESEYTPLLKLLDELYGIKKEVFQIRPSGGFVKVAVWQVDMFNVFNIPKEKGVGKAVNSNFSKPRLIVEQEGVYTEWEAEKIIIATGAWLGELVDAPELQIKQGVSFLFDHITTQSFVSTWAPYKQVTVHPFWLNKERQVTWASDGTAIIVNNWKPSRVQNCLGRIRKQIGKEKSPFETRMGYRPFTVKKIRPCFLEEVEPNIWATTGAGKFGCVAAAWAALQLERIV